MNYNSLLCVILFYVEVIIFCGTVTTVIISPLRYSVKKIILPTWLSTRTTQKTKSKIN